MAMLLSSTMLRTFARYLAWKSRPVGRPPIAPELVGLIEQMARENPLWSRRRIASEFERRRVLHVDVTAHPYGALAARQMVEAIDAETVPTRLVRDRDAIFGADSTHGWTTWASGGSASRRALLGKTDTRNDGSACCAGSCSITLSCLGNGICSPAPPVCPLL
jgi:hypothetical protein